ncbi:PHD finger protein MALE STERILITY 1 [Nicotiana sylvestris]|uniref:PHD finger protein MALE STERILITY 1 n=1 Tax=Nicotiana sylvestris TaxID=4096 RepID=A0A1U7WDV3_NICSY|nr:PREDICTED: PHD finger protein MALE STERILITY 1 [Nicotiana sylvestris]
MKEKIKMSNLDLSGSKKRKRNDQRVFKFKTFGEQGFPTEFIGCNFEQNVKLLLEFAQPEENGDHAMASWSFQLEVHRHPPMHIYLFVVEEPVELSLSHHCKHCKYIGWGNHLICNKKYHFLLPSKDTIAACLRYDHQGGNNNQNTNYTDGEIRSKSSSNLIELEGHIMHGVFHSNGFGHLLCINGLETGSDLPGHSIMDFWDRLCIGLRARKVSLRDISQKKGMDLRLLNTVAYGEPWFGHWGYRFGRGSFGVIQETYQSAINGIQNMPLALLAHHINNYEILTVLSRYQMLSGHSLVTLCDAFHFMLELKSRIPKESNLSSCYPGLLVDNTCRWSPKRVEMAIRVVVEALKRADSRWISRQEVRDAARAYIGDTGLLDFVLKSLGNHIVGKYLVRRCLNPVTKVLEYCLEDISKAFPKHDQGFSVNDSKGNQQYKITWVQLMKDIYFLYKNILKELKGMSNYTSIFATIPTASRIILDTKYFLKEYKGEADSRIEVDKSKIYCAIMLVTKNGFGVEEKVMTPFECFILRKDVTFDELKIEVVRTFGNIYWGLRNFAIRSINNLSPIIGTELVFNVMKPGNKIVLGGIMSNIDHNNIGISEGIKDNIVVDCLCGAKDEDGERMVCCDICEVWQHTRCVNIPNQEAIPDIFLCSECEQDILQFPSLP